MLKPVMTALALTAALSGCAVIRDSAVNPFNWFGRGQEAPAQTASAEEVNPLIPTRRGGLFSRRNQEDEARATTPIDQITDLRVERVPGGAIVRATGLDARIGLHSAALYPSNEDELPEDGVLIYTLERLPGTFPPGGSPQLREVVVGRFVSDEKLRGVRAIQVQAAQNARVSRR